MRVSSTGASVHPVRTASLRLVVAGALLVVQAADARAAGVADGWAEVRSSRPAGAVEPNRTGIAGAETLPGATPIGADGDRLWISRPGDSFASIAQRLTGSDRDASAIARYNRLDENAPLGHDHVLYVPSALLESRVTPEPVAWEILEFGDADEGDASEGNAFDSYAPSDASPVGPPVRRPAPLMTENIDLFAGEVEVLGEVSVSRVAIGNGDIVRAEVLKSGELLVIAQATGSTSLRLWHKDGRQSDYNIRVSESDPETRVRMERMVRMRVRMVEFRKSALGKLGIRWSDSINGPTLSAAGDAFGNALYRPAFDGFEGLPNTVAPFSTYFGIAANITSRINFLTTNGDATTLAEPVLTASNGGSASFLAGGEVPYPSVGANGQTVVQFKEYGVKLDVAPVIDDAGNVRTLIATEISQIDQAVSVNGAPGLLTRRAETQVNVRSGETIVISGLLSSESSSDVEAIPGIGRLPIIGRFFRSKNERSEVRELVIFVTPEVVDPAMATLGERDRSILDDTSRRVDEARASLPLME